MRKFVIPRMGFNSFMDGRLCENDARDSTVSRVATHSKPHHKAHHKVLGVLFWDAEREMRKFVIPRMGLSFFMNGRLCENDARDSTVSRVASHSQPHLTYSTRGTRK